MEYAKHTKVIIPFEYENVFAAMPAEEVGELLTAIFDYMKNGEIQAGLPPLSEAILRHIAYVTETHELLEG